jgi:hypothetical protein
MRAGISTLTNGSLLRADATQGFTVKRKGDHKREEARETKMRETSVPNNS